MKTRLLLLVPALMALVAGLLVASPADAATYSAFLKSKNIAISTAGNGKVAISCHSKSTCKGSIKFVTGTKSKSFSVPGKKTKYVAVAVNASSSANPHNGGVSKNGQYDYKTGVKLRISETAPKKRTHDYTVTTETLLSRQQIKGTVTGPGGIGNVTNPRVELVQVLRGGNIKVVRHDVNGADGYSFNVNLGTNNSASSAFRLRVIAKDQNGVARSWYWRGTSGNAASGGRYLREGSTVRATKYNDFVADFRYSSITGSAPTGTKITVAGPPKSYSGGAATKRELDFTGCANVYGDDTASGGTYRINFLPYRAGDKRYMVAAKYGKYETWNNSFGSCFDVQNYTYSSASLLALTATGLNYPVNPGPSGNSLYVDGAFSGFKATSQGDRWLRLREKVPGVQILDAPVVAEGPANSSGNRRFDNVPPGKYWVELGRRTGCSMWYKSRFPNNSAYFKGADRGSERWKAFRKLGDLPSGYQNIAKAAKPNPAGTAQKTRPSGYAGWMYRSHCKALGAGVYQTVNISGIHQPQRTIKLTSSKGAVVKGRVTRTGGRSNKEIMVRLSSTDGKRVIRTDLTDGSGTFYVAGLPSGNWSISVNSDSWRGIGRSFTGKRSVRVSAGKSYNVGTLRFSG